MSELRTYAEVRDYLYSLKHHGAKYGIDRMQLLARELGNPERQFPVIHIAGTNGKGSTAAMLEAAFRHCGYRTGLFTSPHLVHQGERIQIDRKILSHDAIVTYTRQLKAIAERLAEHDPDDHPSFFEFMTAMAFLRFATGKVDIGLIETGLGGRLDASNVVDPEVSIITSVSLDHTQILGDTLAKIASEKAGIIKPGKPVVIGRLPAEAEEVIRRTAAERGCKLYSIREAFRDHIEDYPETNLAGSFQRINAAIALLTTRVLAQRFSLPQEKVETALRAVNWAGRWDIRQLDDGRRIIFDASHNPEGASMLEENLSRLVKEEGRKPIVVMGTLGEDRARSIVPLLARYAKELYLVRPAQPRACSFEELERCLPPESGLSAQRSKVSRLFPSKGVAAVGDPSDTILVTGSIYLIGEVLEAVTCEEPVAEHILQD